MLADIMSALYSALNTALVAHELHCDLDAHHGIADGMDRGAELGRDSDKAIDALAAEHVAEVSSIFKSERLIFTGGRSGGARSRNSSGAGGEGALVPRGWMEAAPVYPPQPLLMRVADCKEVYGKIGLRQLDCDRLVLIAGSQPHSKLISSNFEASLALFREIEDLLTSSTFNGGYLRGCDGCLSDSARERGDGRQHASQVLRVK